MQPFAYTEPLNHSPWLKKNIRVSVLRLDLFYPEVSGNKYFKLKHNFNQIKLKKIERVISFGGAYSNHIHALAYAAKQHGICATGIIRGEPEYASNATLSDVQSWGMQLKFVSRDEYRCRADPEYLEDLQQRYPAALIIPEGGSNALALKGCAEIVSHIQHALGCDFDTVMLPCGTGATMAGVISALPVDKQVIGVAVLKGADYLDKEIEHYLSVLGASNHASWQLLHHYHGGGYAKCGKSLAQFVNDFTLPIEPVYSGKLFFALDAMIESGAIVEGSHVVAIHTGGMQGLRGMQPLIDKHLAAAN